MENIENKNNKMVQDFQKWVLAEEKDKTGSSILHSIAQTNAYELAQVILEKNPELINERDNFGRTPLFWAFWAGSSLTARFLLSKGAKLVAQDDVLETPLHLAVYQQRYDATKEILFWMLKYDTENKTQARIINYVLQMKNKDGNTPLNISEKLKDSEFYVLFKGIKEICEEKIKEAEKSIYLKEITMHSGPFNGKNISSLDHSILSVKFEMDKENIFLLIQKKNGQHLKVTMELKKFAFLILERVHIRVEITLSSSPLVECFKDGSWIQVNTSIFSTGLSFHCKLSNLQELDKVFSFVKQSNVLNMFQDYCFCYKPTEKTSINKTETKNTSITNKMSILRHKLTNLNIKDTVKTHPEKILKDETFNNFCK